MAHDLMTQEQLAEEWQLKPKTLEKYRSMKIGPPYVKINGAVRYSRKAVQIWQDARTVNHTGGDAA